MLDLSSTLFFKGKFQITSEQDTDLLWTLIYKIRGWMLPKWRRSGEQLPEDLKVWSKWKMGSRFSSENGIVHLSSRHFEENGLHFWACQITESWPSQNGCAPREWTTEVGFCQHTVSSAEVSIVIYYSDRPGFIGPCEAPPAASVPKLIRSLCTAPALRCVVGNYPVRLESIRLAPGDFPAFWQAVCDESREIPLVYLSPRGEEDETVPAGPLLDPQRLAGILGPNALVYYADDLDFSREMTELCSPEGMGCYSGAIRVYAPHPDTEDPSDVYRHRRIPAREILGAEKQTYEILRRALAQDVHFYDKMFRVEDCQKLIDKARAEQRKQELRQSLEEEVLSTAVEQEQNLKDQLEQIEQERFEWELERENYADQINELKGQLHMARSRADQFQSEAVLSGQRKAALEQLRHIASYPETPLEIARYFTTHFADRLDFTERGWASLDDCKTAPDVLWDALYQMATTLYDLYETEAPAVDQAFGHTTSLRMARGEGAMTRRDNTLMKQFRDVYAGREINIEAHIKTSQSQESSPKFLRVYFCYDSTLRKILIGHCGSHLDNYSTRKIK